MKPLILSLISLFLITPAFAETCEKPQTVATVNGMVCDFCVQSLKKVFLKDPAVQAVDIDLGTKEVTLTLKPGQTLDDQAIKKTVEWGGYELAKVERSCS